MKTEIGTPDFVAPEVSNPRFRRDYPSHPSGYSCKVDMWSLGIVVHILLTNSVPPKPTQPLPGCTIEDSQQLDSQAEKYEPDYCSHFEYDPAWLDVSELATDFVRSLLQIDETKRPSAKDAKEHKWLRRHRKILEDLWRCATKDWKPRNAKLSDIWIQGAAGKLTALEEEEEENEDEDQETAMFEPPRLHAVPDLMEDIGSDSEHEVEPRPIETDGEITVIPDSQSQKSQPPENLGYMDLDLPLPEDTEMHFVEEGMRNTNLVTESGIDMDGDVEMQYEEEDSEKIQAWNEVAGSGKMMKVSELVKGVEERLSQQRRAQVERDAEAEREWERKKEREIWMGIGASEGSSVLG